MNNRRIPHFIRQAAVIAAVAVMCVGGWVRPASAELVTFSTGRTMAIKAHHEDGSSLVFTLRAGGEMVVDTALVTSIGPDEVPWPEPVEAQPAVASFSSVPSPGLSIDTRFDPIIRK